jgi:hypothetical protein
VTKGERADREIGKYLEADREIGIKGERADREIGTQAEGQMGRWGDREKGQIGR